MSTADLQEDHLRTIIDAIPTLVWSARPDGSADYFNQQWLDYTGLSMAQARDWGWTGAIHPDDRTRLIDYWRSILTTGEPGEIDARLRRADGEYRWFLFRGNAWRDVSGAVLKWYGTNTDIEDRRRADDAVRASERESRLIVDTIPGLVAIMTAAGEVALANRQVQDYFGRSLEELQRWAFSDAVHPDDLPGVITAWTRAFETGEPYDIVHRIRRVDGVYRWFHVRGLPVRDIDGGISRWHVLLTDVDDRKRGEETARAREEQLRRSEALLLEAQRLTRTGSWSHNPVTGRIASSPEMRRAFGVRPDEDSTTREFWLNKVHPDDRQRVHELFSRSELEKTDYETDYRVVLPDGTIRHKHAVGHPIVSESGDLVEFIVTTMDVTEQWQARTELEKANLALRASERELSLIVETIPGLVWCASPDGEFTYMNQRILNYIGTSESDLTRGGWANFLHPDDRESAVAAWSHAVATGQPFELEIRLRRYDGVYRWMHTLSQLDRDSEGHPRRWYGLLIDIDDRKHTENALRSTQTRLTRATQIATVGELSASIAHEINQPLAAVVANGHACQRWLAAQPPNLAKAREAVERVVRDGKEAGEVVARIRALFKRATLQEVALDLNEVIGEVLRLLRGETAKRHVTVETDLAHDLPSVMGDRVQLQQLVLNLLLNGVEAMDPVVDRPRTLLVRTRRDGSERILVEMRDSGLGLKDPEKVFEAFFTTKESGMGMGLTICRSIVEAHHGRVWAASGEGPGATFCFTLPLTPGAAP